MYLFILEIVKQVHTQQHQYTQRKNHAMQNNIVLLFGHAMLS